MFGAWVESRVRDAVEAATRTKGDHKRDQADRKAEQALTECLTEPGSAEAMEVPKGKFRDPAEFVGRL